MVAREFNPSTWEAERVGVGEDIWEIQLTKNTYHHCLASYTCFDDHKTRITREYWNIDHLPTKGSKSHSELQFIASIYWFHNIIIEIVYTEL